MAAELIMAADIPIPEEVYLIKDVLQHDDPSVEVYAVGGVVRDYLYNRFHKKSGEWKPKDIDITTNLSEEEILAKLKAGPARITVNEKKSVDTFGVVFVGVHGEGPFEIAPFRKDIGGSDGRRPDKVERGTIEEDAARRDFTINNLYYDLDNGLILDFNKDGQGVNDIKDKVVRTVGRAEDRFKEDKLRILRMIRFFCRYNSGSFEESLDRDTDWAIRSFNNLRSYSGMSGERIMTEFLAGLAQSLNTYEYLTAYDSMGLMDAVFPDMKVSTFLMPNMEGVKSPRVVLAGLLAFNDHLSLGLNKLNYPNDIVRGACLMQQALLFDPKDAVPMLKEKNRLFVSAKNRDLLPSEEASNEVLRGELEGDFKDMLLMLSSGEQTRRTVIRHLMHYSTEVPDGNELIKQGFVGSQIGQQQNLLMQKAYEESLFKFIFR